MDTASERYRRGAALYVQHCAKCHDRQEGGQKSPDGSITYGLQEIGTDPLRATNFAKPLEDGKPFTQELQAVAAKVKNHANIGANPGEHRGRLDLPERADPLADDSGLRRTAAGRGLGHRSVSAQWIGAHAGRPAQARGRAPVCFPLGHREYDPVKLGYVSEFTKVPAAERSRIFVYDTRDYRQQQSRSSLRYSISVRLIGKHSSST